MIDDRLGCPVLKRRVDVLTSICHRDHNHGRDLGLREGLVGYMHGRDREFFDVKFH